MRQISAIGIKKLWYGNEIEEPLAQKTAAAVATLLAGQTGSVKNFTEIENVHQDTWAIEEAEPSQDSYRNQLTGKVYRRGQKNMGDVTINFTIGRYDFGVKASLMGGTSDGTSWTRGDGAQVIHKTIVALTEDDVYVIFPSADVSARESNTDGAIGIALSAIALEPCFGTKEKPIPSEYWIDAFGGANSVHPKPQSGQSQG